jgi:hypothetical protein
MGVGSRSERTDADEQLGSLGSRSAIPGAREGGTRRDVKRAFVDNRRGRTPSWSAGTISIAVWRISTLVIGQAAGRIRIAASIRSWRGATVVPARVGSRRGAAVVTVVPARVGNRWR